MDYYQYGKLEINYLKDRDHHLGLAIDQIGMIKRAINPDLFSALVSSIISQQISTKAATTVKTKLTDALGVITPETIDLTQASVIQACGMSYRKADYLKNIADLSISGTVNFSHLATLENDNFIRELIKIKGVGEWTAEMLLIHSLQRKDVISYKDLGIRRGIMRLYGLGELSKEIFKDFRTRYSPYATVASFYLWEISASNYRWRD